MWKDIDIQLRQQQDGDIRVMTEEEAITNSLYNIFTTMQGSRRMRPTFPFPLHNVLFDQVDVETAGQVGGMLVDAIHAWDDRIDITNVHVNSNEDANSYEVSLTFTVKNSSQEPQVFNFILNQQG